MADNASSESVLGLDGYKSNAELASVDLFEGFSQSLLLFGFVCFIVFMIIGIPGNLITIIALARYKKIQNATAIFIINLHIADLIFCLTILPIAAATIFDRHWNSGKTICYLYPITNYTLCGVSLHTIVAISINRYVLCCHPLLYKSLYRGRYICLMIIGMWLFSFVLTLPSFFEIMGRYSLDPHLGFCTMVEDKHGRSPKLSMHIIGFGIPCIVMCICYIRLMWVVRKTTRKCQQTEMKVQFSKISEGISEDNATCKLQNEKYSSEETELQKHRRVTFIRKTIGLSLPKNKDKKLRKMIIVIIVTFFISRLPYFLVHIKDKGSTLYPRARVIGWMLIYSINCLNPIIYVLTSNEFRKAYKNLFKTVTNKSLKV